MESLGIPRTKSDQLDLMSARKSPSEITMGTEQVGGGLARKSSFGKLMSSASPGRSKHQHIRKSRSAQLKVDLDEASSAALSRASSASLGFSFSFTGFTVPPEDDIIARLRGFSDDDDDDDDNDNGMYDDITNIPLFRYQPFLPPSLSL
ncbi:hypothetical protein ACLOJK_040842 [Asimina triloba]